MQLFDILIFCLLPAKGRTMGTGPSSIDRGDMKDMNHASKLFSTMERGTEIEAAFESFSTIDSAHEGVCLFCPPVAKLSVKSIKKVQSFELDRLQKLQDFKSVLLFSICYKNEWFVFTFWPLYKAQQSSKTQPLTMTSVINI